METLLNKMLKALGADPEGFDHRLGKLEFIAKALVELLEKKQEVFRWRGGEISLKQYGDNVQIRFQKEGGDLKWDVITLEDNGEYRRHGGVEGIGFATDDDCRIREY